MTAPDAPSVLGAGLLFPPEPNCCQDLTTTPERACHVQVALSALGVDEPPHGAAMYGVLHLADVGVHEHAEMPVCAMDAGHFRAQGTHRVRTLPAPGRESS